ncbi:MAG: hypothetical protein HRU38_18360 [Saccharospirillaceae bacterium]|nr:hypothetical protein [Pseudomonadales bacterium]NRB80601.1 hypothetical protein [Saccharospirillaceae bacterium]
MTVLNLKELILKHWVSVVVIGVAFTSALIFWKLTDNNQINYKTNLSHSLIKSSGIILAKSKNQVDIDPVVDNVKQISETHLFGRLDEKPLKDNVVQIDHSKKPSESKDTTDLSFIILASAVSEQSKNSMVLIEYNKIKRWFKEGESVFENTTVFTIYDQYVEFKKTNGEIKKILIKNNKNNTKTNTKYSSLDLNNAFETDQYDFKRNDQADLSESFKSKDSEIISSNNEYDEIVSNIKNIDEIVKITNHTEIEIKKEINDQIIKAKLNPNVALTKYGIKFIQGKGYLVTSKAHLLKLFGFKAGDIITKINGYTASTPQTDIKLIDEIVESGEVLIEYNRNGRVFIMKQSL